MGLTKQYLAYKPLDSFNLIASGRANVNFLIYNKIEGRYVAVSNAENAVVWDLRLGEKVLTFRRDKQEVTALRPSPDKMHIAVGYADGVVEIFDLASENSEYSLSLHKTAVSILRYDNMGIRLVSGGLDTELVVIDVISQSGKNRLSGHNGSITDAHFFERLGENNIVVSSAKDTQIKFWNLETQMCFKTIVDNRTEVWSLVFIRDLMICGCSERTLNVYRLCRKDTRKIDIANAVEGLSVEDDDTICPISVVNCGTLLRAGKGRTVSLIVDQNERILSCHGTNGLIENFYFYTIDEAKYRLAKRLKKAEKKKILDVSTTNENHNEISLSDEIKRLDMIRTKEKIKSIDIILGVNNQLRIIVNLANNSLHLYELEVNLHCKLNDISNADHAKLLRSITQCGHQSEVRCVAFSSDSLVIASGGGDSLKIWNRESMKCVKTIHTEYVLTCCFVPGDRYILLGLKSGKLIITDVNTGEILEEIPAHEKEIWSITLLPDQQGCVTGSSDATVKIMIFALINSSGQENVDENNHLKVLSLLHKSTLKLEEAVLCVRVSPDSKFIAAGLLDCTVKIFFLDSLKFYLTLYGHKLPVLCMDISYDSRIISTGSADRNIKIWGLDFGDCHRSLFAHDDSVMSLQFIPKTHLFFTCGKDGKIKMWDGDTFEKVMTLPGHIGEAYCLTISSNGRFLSTCGSDRTIRLYERTDEILVLQDVQEEEREEMENQALATGDDNNVSILPSLKLPSRKTVGAEKATESILECLEICKEYENDETPDLHPLMRAHNVKTPDDFLLDVFCRIRASDMEAALVLLPFSNVCEILERIPRLSEKRTDHTEMICKIVNFIFRIHQKPIASNQTILPIIGKIIGNLERLIVECRDTIGINLQSMHLLQRSIEEREGVQLFRDVIQARKKREQRKKFIAKRTFIEMR